MVRNLSLLALIRRSFFLTGSAILLLAGLFLAPAIAQAQENDAPPMDEPAAADCASCHLNVTARWEDSPHAHAFDDPIFQEWWAGQGFDSDCLACHTTGYNALTGEYKAEGITCEACHGPVIEDHPPAVVPIRSDTEYCGACHTPTLSEWRLSGHGAAGIGCISCHDPHSQLPLFTVPDDMCINCHQDDMGDYLEDLHIQEGIGCVDCHTLVIPPEEMPVDGLVPTGHQFTITPATCVACHTDALHAGFALPGWERGAGVSARDIVTPTFTIPEQARPLATDNGLALEQRLQAMEAALASRTMTELFQGGIIGLVLGGTTAWLVAHNVRQRHIRREEEEENGDEAQD